MSSALRNYGGENEPPSIPSADQWSISVRDRLFARRVTFLSGWLDDLAANDIAAQLMTLDATGDDPIELHLDSPGGTLGAALSLIDVIDLLGVELHATCSGQLVGPTVGLLAVAHRRRCMPHARFRLLVPDVGFRGPAVDVQTFVEAHGRQLRSFLARLAEATRQPEPRIAEDLASGRFLDADSAVAYGLVDEICTRRARVYPLYPRSLGFRPSR